MAWYCYNHSNWHPDQQRCPMYEASQKKAVFPRGELDVPRPVEPDATGPVNPIRVERESEDGINLEVSAVHLSIIIKYDAQLDAYPFSYELTFPEDMYRFFYESGLTDDMGLSYTGTQGSYRDAHLARNSAEQEAGRIVARYKKYLKNRLEAQSYYHTVKL